MFTHLQPKHFIDEGRVHCPRREHDVEVDLCAGCRWLERIRLDARPPYVECELERPSVFPSGLRSGW